MEKARNWGKSAKAVVRFRYVEFEIWTIGEDKKISEQDEKLKGIFTLGNFKREFSLWISLEFQFPKCTTILELEKSQ